MQTFFYKLKYLSIKCQKKVENAHCKLVAQDNILSLLVLSH